MTDLDQLLGRALYEARFPNHGTRYGEREWEKQPPEVQAIWIACAKAVLEAVAPLIQAAERERCALDAWEALNRVLVKEDGYNTDLEDHVAASIRGAAVVPTRRFDWIGIAQRGFDAWAAKPHNAKWLKRIDGTPIPNDLTICIGQAFADARFEAIRKGDSHE